MDQNGPKFGFLWLKSTPPPVVTVVTNMSYAMLCYAYPNHEELQTTIIVSIWILTMFKKGTYLSIIFKDILMLIICEERLLNKALLICYTIYSKIPSVTDEYVSKGCEVKGETFENISKGISPWYSRISWCWWICEEWLWNEGEDGEIVLSVVTQCQRPQHVVIITISFSYSCFVRWMLLLWCEYVSVLYISAYCLWRVQQGCKK